MRITCLQHGHLVEPANIQAWAQERGHEVETVKLYESHPLPDPSSFDWLVVLGGKMGVHDEAEHPWLVPEKRFLKSVIEQGKPVVGVCLGAQLIAHVLGADVRVHEHPEIGWWPITLTDEARDTALFAGVSSPTEVFQWHNDTFDIPEGATQLAYSEGCYNQGFLYGDRVLGLQFHPEFSLEKTHEIVTTHSPDEFRGRFVQQPEMFLADAARFERLRALLYELLDRFVERPAAVTH